MQTRTINLVTYRTLDPVEVELADDTTCEMCSNPPIGGMVFPEPYQIAEAKTVQGNLLLCEEHIDLVQTDAKII